VVKCNLVSLIVGYYEDSTRHRKTFKLPQVIVGYHEDTAGHIAYYKGISRMTHRGPPTPPPTSMIKWIWTSRLSTQNSLSDTLGAWYKCVNFGEKPSRWEDGWGGELAGGKRLRLWPGFEQDLRANIGVSALASGARIKVFLPTQKRS